MPTEISRNASGTQGGYMNFTNGFGIINNRFSEDQYDARLSYSNKFSDFDVNAFVGTNITQQKTFNNSSTMNVFGNAQWLINPDVYNFASSNVRINPAYSEFRKTFKSLYSSLSVGYNDLERRTLI